MIGALSPGQFGGMGMPSVGTGFGGMAGGGMNMGQASGLGGGMTTMGGGGFGGGLGSTPSLGSSSAISHGLLGGSSAMGM